MLAEWIRALLDVILILAVGAGVVQATRLIRHLAGLRQSRAEMERFVRDFDATVARAEAGIKGLRSAARESGDDLEKLVEKACLVRDELHYIVESADQIAERLSKGAASAIKPEARPEASPSEPAAPAAARKVENKPANAAPPVSSRAEKELLRALEKMR